MEQSFSTKLNELLSIASETIIREFANRTVQYLHSVNKSTSEVTVEEILQNVQLESKGESSSNVASKRTTRLPSAKPSPKGVLPLQKAVDGPPRQGYCGYVRCFGDHSGTYCPNEAKGEIYHLEEGDRQFCDSCKNSKQIVKDIINGSATTLTKKKATSTRKTTKGKATQEVPDDKRPGEQSTAIPGEDKTTMTIVPYGGTDNLVLVTGTNFILYRDDPSNPKAPYFLVAIEVNGEIVAPDQKAKDWANDAQVEILEKPELYDSPSDESHTSVSSSSSSVVQQEEEPTVTKTVSSSTTRKTFPPEEVPPEKEEEKEEEKETITKKNPRNLLPIPGKKRPLNK